MEAPSEVLKRIISDRGLTAYKVAKDAEVSEDAVRRFLNGERGLTIATFDAICKSLGLELTEGKKPRRMRKTTDEPS